MKSVIYRLLCIDCILLLVVIMLAKRLKTLVILLLLAGATPMLAGCGGAVNVQASGGGTDGFASLGVIMLGTSAIRYIRELSYAPVKIDDEPLPPPHAVPEQQPDNGNADDHSHDRAGEAYE